MPPVKRPGSPPGTAEIAQCIVDLIGIAADRVWPNDPDAVESGPAPEKEKAFLEEVVGTWRKLRAEEFVLADATAQVRQRALDYLSLAEVLEDLLGEFRDNDATSMECKQMIRGVFAFHGEAVAQETFGRDDEARFETDENLRKWIRTRGPGDASKELVGLLLPDRVGVSRSNLAKAKALRKAPEAQARGRDASLLSTAPRKSFASLPIPARIPLALRRVMCQKLVGGRKRSVRRDPDSVPTARHPRSRSGADPQQGGRGRGTTGGPQGDRCVHL